MKTCIKTIIAVGLSITLLGGILFTIGYANAKRTQKAIVNTYEISEEFGDFDITLTTANLEFKASEDGTTKVVCKETENLTHAVSVVDNTLTIKASDKTKWYENAFNFSFLQCKITVYVPTEHIGFNVKIDATTGDVNLPKGFEFSSVNIKMSTGDANIGATIKGNLKVKNTTGTVTVSESSCKTAEFTASTGDIKLNSFTVDETLNISTTTGDIKLNNVNCGSLTVDVSTGDVKLIDTVASGNMQITATTGDVRFDNADANSLKIKTSTGNVTGSLKTGKKFVCDTSVGDIRVPNTDGGVCEIKTSTGDIIITIKE